VDDPEADYAQESISAHKAATRQDQGKPVQDYWGHPRSWEDILVWVTGQPVQRYSQRYARPALLTAATESCFCHPRRNFLGPLSRRMGPARSEAHAQADVTETPTTSDPPHRGPGRLRLGCVRCSVLPRSAQVRAPNTGHRDAPQQPLEIQRGARHRGAGVLPRSGAQAVTLTLAFHEAIRATLRVACTSAFRVGASQVSRPR
jgi:hypothetical protein